MFILGRIFSFILWEKKNKIATSMDVFFCFFLLFQRLFKSEKSTWASAWTRDANKDVTAIDRRRRLNDVVVVVVVGRRRPIFHRWPWMRKPKKSMRTARRENEKKIQLDATSISSAKLDWTIRSNEVPTRTKADLIWGFDQTNWIAQRWQKDSVNKRTPTLPWISFRPSSQRPTSRLDRPQNSLLASKCSALAPLHIGTRPAQLAGGAVGGGRWQSQRFAAKERETKKKWQNQRPAIGSVVVAVALIRAASRRQGRE